MNKFKHSEASDIGANRAARVDRGVQASFPRRPLLPRLAVVSVFGIFMLVGILFAYFQPVILRNWDALSKRVVYLRLPGSNRQEVNANTLVGLPGGQFLPTLEHPLNILVMGVDSNGKGTQRFVGTRSDTMMFVSIDPQNNRVAVISIPRDSRVEIANGRGSSDKINAAHALGGPQLAMATIKQAFNVCVDRYLVIDEEGFKRALEVLGPVDVLVEKKMNYEDHTAALSINLEPGLKQLDAKQAEGYIRFRHDAKGDIGRIERQQWFARQLANKFSDPQTILKLPQLLKVASDCSVTDLTVDEMVKLVGFACRLDSHNIEMASLPGAPGSISGISYWVPDAEAARAIFNKLVRSDSQADVVNNVQAANEGLAVAQDSAMAYTRDVADSPVVVPSEKNQCTAIIRYPKGSEEQVKALALLLADAGVIIKGKYRADLTECQHEQIVENSVRALSLDICTMRAKLPCLHSWTNVINIDKQATADLIFVVTPNSIFPERLSAVPTTAAH